MRSSLVAAFMLLLSACTGCVGQVAVDASPPSQVDTVQFAIRHSVLLDPPGCTGVEVADGLVITAKHCIEEDDVVGNDFGDRHGGGKIKWISPDHDVVVIEYPRLFRHAQVHLRDHVVGEHVYIVGFPVQLRSDKQELTVTDGLMAGPTDEDGTARTTAEAYFGNSGGGVWGEDGALLGILVSINAAPGLPGAPMPYPAQTYMVPVKFVNVSF